MTEQEIINRLLSPRYKVISDWPGRKDFIVGEVVALDKDFSPEYKKYEIEDCQRVRFYINAFFDMFPLQFKKLQWWQDRKHFDLPKYIKWVSPGSEEVSFFEVNNWYTSPNTSEIAGAEVNAGRMFIMDCWPATEQEYNDYIKSKS